MCGELTDVASGGDIDGILRALANERRREILECLREAAAAGDAPLTITRLAQRTGMDRFATSRHLAILRRAGLVSALRRRERFEHSLNGVALEELEEWLLRFLV